jgi:hypothetical protein
LLPRAAASIGAAAATRSGSLMATRAQHPALDAHVHGAVAGGLDDRAGLVHHPAEIPVGRHLHGDRLTALDALHAGPERDPARCRLTGGDPLAERPVEGDATRDAAERQGGPRGVEAGERSGADGGAPDEVTAVETWLDHGEGAFPLKAGASNADSRNSHASDGGV